ncbi:MAG: hypothetical protein Q9227_003860 [Pyrenula ochraceoflavens]
MDRARKNVHELSKSLDSSLKKNTAFIKRCRTGITAQSLPTFLAEIKTLSLHKYLSEIISATYEGLCKLKTPGEVSAGVEVVSALHQRFGPLEFTRQVGWLLGRGLASPDRAQVKSWSQDVREREEKERLARHRVLLKVVTELWLVGVLRSLEDTDGPDEAANKVKDASQTNKSSNTSKAKTALASGSRDMPEEAESFPLEVLKELLGQDRDHTNLPLAVLFVKSFGWDVLGVRTGSEESRKIVESNGDTAGDDLPGDAMSRDEAAASGQSPSEAALVSDKLQTRFKNVLNRYFNDVKNHIIRDQRALNTQSRRNAEAYVKSGEIFEDRQANFDKQSKAQERLIANAQVLCDVLGGEMPDLAEKDSVEGSAAASIGLVKAGEYLKGQGDGAGIWEDEEERRFYENLVDLKGRVPSILLEDGKKKKADVDDASTRNVTQTESGESLDAKTVSETQPQADDQSATIANKTVGAQVDALLARLTELQTKEGVDNFALEFCFLNSKASRHRLIKALQDVPKGRSDLLPLYARLAATLGQYLQDIIQSLISHLDDEFRSLQRRKVKDFLGQVRTTNIRYLAELTKFGVVPEHVIFHCFKVSLDDFSRMNIEILGNLLENCGRYLLRYPETSPRMNSFLETLERKKTAQHLGQQERMLIENAMYYVNPPQRSAIQQKEHTPTELFIRQMVYLDLSKRNYSKVLKTLRKLHWEEPEVVSVLVKVFSKPGKVKYSNIYLLATLISGLYRYHQDFVITVIDNLLEQITLGLEQNDFKYNQRRIAEARYLGELYNYKMIDSSVVFDTLYQVVVFGHENGTPTPGRYTQFDLPDDFFRVRLVCAVLETCGMCFDRGSAKKKLDFFLTFFQYYLTTKEPLPLDIDFLVQDTYAVIRPQWKLITELNEAARLFAEAVTINYATAGTDKTNEIEEDRISSASSDELEADVVHEPFEPGAQSSSDENDELPNGDASPIDSVSEEEQIYVKRQDEERDPEAEADFDREFEKMMAESIESRKFERRTMFDVPLPIRRGQQDAGATNEGDEIAQAQPKTMAFSFMTKKGNRQQTRNIDLPSDSTFAVAMKTQQQAEREEQQRIKSLVLNNYDLRDDNDLHDGDSKFSSSDPYLLPLEGNLNTKKGRLLGLERHNASTSSSQPRSVDRASHSRSGQRARKLQLSDVDWYGNKSKSRSSSHFHRRGPPPARAY